MKFDMLSGFARSVAKPDSDKDVQIAELKQMLADEKNSSQLRYQALELSIVRCETAVKKNFENLKRRIDEIES